jgi:hypothetical protein
VSVPDVTFTSYPPAVTTSRDAAFTFTVTNPAGESYTSIGCRKDNNGPWQPCGSGQFSFSNVSDGTHHISVEVITPSGIWQEHQEWRVDGTKPTASGPPPDPSVSGPLVITFSEEVTNVTAATMKVTVAGSTTALAGTLALGTISSPTRTTATWTPATPLVPGETYDISLTDGIADLVGNTLAPTVRTTRTSLLVDSASPAWTELWDRDTGSSASGGAYSVSTAPGSTATWTFTATEGQKALLYGTKLVDGGYADIWVDGVKLASNVSFDAAATTWKQNLYTTPALSAGQHTVQVRVLGTRPSTSRAPWVAIDYLQVGTKLFQETAARHTFRRVANASASAGSYDLVTHRTDSAGAPTFQLVFRGTGATLFVTKTSTSGSAKVYVDGVLKATVSTNSAGTFYQQGAYSVAGLTDARHTIKVVSVGTSTGSSSTIGVDHLTVVAAA